MTDSAITEMTVPDLVNVLKEVTTNTGEKKSKDIYAGLYKKLMDALEEKKGNNIRGLMSQAIVPRLIRKMAKITEKSGIDRIKLKTELTKVDPDITSDYPYERTQIIEVLTRVQKNNGEDLYETFKDPLLVTAVRITNELTNEGGNMDLSTIENRKKISEKVNKIQDLIVRTMIHNETGVIPMIGGEKKKGRAFGLGENPNPEVAAILNPGLVMTGDEQIQYHRELAMLAELISPKESKNLAIRSVGDVFEKAGFKINEKEKEKEVQIIEEEILEIGGVKYLNLAENLAADKAAILKIETDKLKNSLGEKTELVHTLTTKNKKDQTQIVDLKEDVLVLEGELERSENNTDAALASSVELKHECLKFKAIIETQKETIADLEKIIDDMEADQAKPLPETKDDDDDDEEEEEDDDDEEEAETDYNEAAMNFLITYLGVSNNIYKLTKNWMELYADNSDNPIFKDYTNVFKDEPEADDVLRVGLSSLIVTHEKIGVIGPPYYMEDDDVKVTLDHKKIIEIWNAIGGDSVKPKQTDLVIQKSELGVKGKAIAEAIKKALLDEKKKVASFLPKQQPRLVNQINTNTEIRRSRQKRNKKDERVLIW